LVPERLPQTYANAFLAYTYALHLPARRQRHVFLRRLRHLEIRVVTGRYQLAGEYAGPGPVPYTTLPGLGLDWSDVFAEPAK
jgi:hypothetical protein